MEERRVEGIVLKSIQFKENDRILSVFTPERGIVSVIVKRLSKNRTALVNLTTPLCRGEYIFRKGRSDLHTFIDGTILDLHLSLRKSYGHLEVAGKMLNGILKSQMPGKAAPALYALLITYLRRIADFSDAAPLWASFQLKLLYYEGLLALEETCIACSTEKASRVINGESRCVGCSDALSYPFSNEEWEVLQDLLHVKQFEALKSIKLDPSMSEGIEAIYTNSLVNCMT